MLLTFSKDRFVDQIKSGIKIHTIREDKHRRWKNGTAIDFWRGNPRNVRGKIRPFKFGAKLCTGTEEIIIRRTEIGESQRHGLVVMVLSKDGSRHLSDNDIEKLAINDGLTVEELRDWFVPDSSPNFMGRIIHWTDVRYSKSV